MQYIHKKLGGSTINVNALVPKFKVQMLGVQKYCFLTWPCIVARQLISPSLRLTPAECKANLQAIYLAKKKTFCGFPSCKVRQALMFMYWCYTS